MMKIKIKLRKKVKGKTKEKLTSLVKKFRNNWEKMILAPIIWDKNHLRNYVMMKKVMINWVKNSLIS